jgi:YVTN family beta-propeller protein
MRGIPVLVLSLLAGVGAIGFALVPASHAAARKPRIRVGSQPLNVIAAGPSRLWTENYGDGTVSVIDARAAQRLRTVQVGGSPGGLAYGGGAIWVSDLSNGQLTRLSARGVITGRSHVATAGAGVAVHRGVVYVADSSGGLVRVDATTMKVLGRTQLPGHPEAVAVGFGRVWVANGNGTINVLHAATGAVAGRAIRIGGDVDDIKATPTAVWAVSLYGGRLVRIAPRTRRITRKIRLPGQGSGLLVGAKSVWVSTYDTGTVLRINARRGRVVHSYGVGTEPRGLAFAAGAVWVANQGSDSVVRVAHR